MNKKNRKYSLPYNGTSPEWYIDEVMKRKQYVDHVFCELPNGEALSHVRFQFSDKNMNFNFLSLEERKALHMFNCIEFLKKSKGKFKRICPINAMYYKFNSYDDIKNFAVSIMKTVNDLSIDGLILTDYRLASFIHACRPDFEIHTSCNAYQWNIRQMDLWREKCGVTIFNPPREILRVPSKLKEMADYGFKLKCLINEGCLVGCPNSFLHQLSISLKCFPALTGCCQSGIGDLFRGNWILPRWQKYFDDYVYIYKIAGRNSKKEYPFIAIDAYINENNTMPLLDLMISGTAGFGTHFLPEEIRKKITLDIVPDKLMTCECKNCDKCQLCEKILSKYVPSSYNDKFTYKVKITGQ